MVNNKSPKRIEKSRLFSALKLHLHKLAFAGSLVCSINAMATDLISAYHQAVDYDSSIAASHSAFNAQREGEFQSRAGLLPQLAFSASANHIDRSADVGNNDSFKTRSYGLTLSQPLFRAANWYGYQASKENTKLAKIQHEAAQQQLILDVATAYFNVLRAEDLVRTTQAADTAFKRQWEQAKERFDVGLIAITEVHEARAGYDASQTSRIQAESNLDIAKENLSRLTGQKLDSIARLSKMFSVSQLTPATPEEWETQALETNLSLQASRQILASLEDALQVEKAGHYPTLDLVAGYESNDFNGPSPANDTYNNASIGLSFNMPLYQGGGTTASIRKARFQLEEAQHNLETATRNIKLQTSSLFRTVKTDIQTVSSQKQLIVSRESALEATRAGYDVGTRNIVEVLDAESRYYSALFDYANARYDYILDTLQLKLTAGTLAAADIEALNKALELK